MKAEAQELLKLAISEGADEKSIDAISRAIASYDRSIERIDKLIRNEMSSVDDPELQNIT